MSRGWMMPWLAACAAILLVGSPGCSSSETTEGEAYNQAPTVEAGAEVAAGSGGTLANDTPDSPFPSGTNPPAGEIISTPNLEVVKYIQDRYTSSGKNLPMNFKDEKSEEVLPLKIVDVSDKTATIGDRTRVIVHFEGGNQNEADLWVSGSGPEDFKILTLNLRRNGLSQDFKYVSEDTFVSVGTAKPLDPNMGETPAPAASPGAAAPSPAAAPASASPATPSGS